MWDWFKRFTGPSLCPKHKTPLEICGQEYAYGYPGETSDVYACRACNPELFEDRSSPAAISRDRVFEFLWWFRQVAFFRDDLFKEIMALTGDEGMAYMVSRCNAVQQADSILFWHLWHTEPWFHQFLTSYIEKWEAYATTGS